jgi:disulfide bond formation protein DsbB
MTQSRLTDQQRTYAAAAAVTLAIIGAAMQFQTVSLLTGDSVYWYGGAAALAGTVAAFIGEARNWVRWVAVIALVMCISNIAQTEHTLNQRRHEIQQILTPPSQTP